MAKIKKSKWKTLGYIFLGVVIGAVLFYGWNAVFNTKGLTYPNGDIPTQQAMVNELNTFCQSRTGGQNWNGIIRSAVVTTDNQNNALWYPAKPGTWVVTVGCGSMFGFGGGTYYGFIYNTQQ
jgi:hypothetical protein